MRARGSFGRRLVTVLSACSILMSPGGVAPSSLLFAQSADAPPRDGGWPRHYTGPDAAAFVLYEPQIASWEGQRLLTMHAAVA